MPPFNPPNPTGQYFVTGIERKSGESPGIRQEIRDFKNDHSDAWNLYLLGLWQFQLVPQDKLLSYFQIAGIHGLPYESWPEDDKKILKLARERDKSDNDDFGGFCTHSSILFLTWHRPYLALFESLLRDAMIHVAKQFTPEEGQEKYLAAAEAFRMPFWDWARTDHAVFPEEATASKVQVTMPESLRKEYEEFKDIEERRPVEIPNPLYSYHFGPGTPENVKVDNLEVTTRYHEKGKSDEEPEKKKGLLVESLTPYTEGLGFYKRTRRQMEINLGERVVYLLQSYELFSQVSNNRRWGPKEDEGQGQNESYVKGWGFGSFEDVHNAMHNLVGGNGADKQGIKRSGHMTDPAVSAFDPIFWLHHTNIDRLLAIWQDLRVVPDREDAWVTTQEAEDGNWATAIDDKETLLTDLLPFYKEKDKFWNSDQVRNTADFGYAYPETQSWAFTDRALYRQSINDQIRILYPSASLANMVTATRAGDKGPDDTLQERAERLKQIEKVDEPNTALTALSLVFAANPEASITPDLKSILLPVEIPTVQVPKNRSVVDLVKGETYLEWLVNIKAVKHALGGGYLVHIFLGPVPLEEDEPTVLYTMSPYHVGTFSPFGQAETTSCGKCQKDQAAGIEITGQIPLTIALAERYFAGKLASLDEEEVKKYLQENLHWEVIDQNGHRLKLKGGRKQLPGLLVGVVSNEVTLPKTEEGFPRYSEYITVYPDITTKKDKINGRGEGTGITEENKHFC